jgi:hypothetical protein
MKFYWFGDSWVYGDELQNRQECFAQLVSDQLGAECKNLAIVGNSVDLIPLQFHSIADKITPDDRVFFFLTADARTVAFDNQAKWLKIMPNPGFDHQSFHPHTDQWYRYFDTPAQRIWNYDRTINLLWLWCEKIGVRGHFANIFTTPDAPIIDCVPESAWLWNRNHCLSSVLLPHSNNRMGRIITDDCPELTQAQWQEQKTAVAQWISPNHAHPNSAGHAKLAQAIAERLQ